MMVRYVPDNNSVPSTLFKHIVLALTRVICFLKTAARPDPDISNRSPGPTGTRDRSTTVAG